MFPSSEKIEDTTSRTGTRQTTAQQAVYKHSRKQAGLKGLISRKHLITSSKTSSGREPRQHGRSLSIEQRSIVRRHSTATMDEQLHLTFKERVRHFTWTWFTMTMATGGVANVLYQVPYRFPGLYVIGVFFFLLNIGLFIFNVTMISLRFRYHPSTFRSSITHPTESLFVPAWLISLGTILINITQYGTTHGKTGMWLLDTMFVLFWVDCVLAIAFSCGIFLVMWSTQTFTIEAMTPVWIFPAYPLLIIGPHAAVLSAHLDSIRAVYVIIGGWIFQGIGFLVSLMVYASFIYRLMTQKLPKANLRPGMFISVGPSGFTIAGVINMGQVLPKVVPDNFMDNGYLAGQIGKIGAIWVGLWLWGLAFWFFIVSVGAHWSCVRDRKMTFAMTWYSFIFPNTALTTATFAVGNALDVTAIRVLGCVMTCLLIVAWTTVFIVMIRAVIVKDILWPQKQEDREEGGWKATSQAYPRRVFDSDYDSPVRRRETFGNVLESREHISQQDYGSSDDFAAPGGNARMPPVGETLVDQSIRGGEKAQDVGMV